MDTFPRSRQVNPPGPMGSSSGTGPLGSTWEDQDSVPHPCPLCQRHCRWIQDPVVSRKKSVEPGIQGTALHTRIWYPLRSGMALESAGFFSPDGLWEKRVRTIQKLFQSVCAVHRDGSTGKLQIYPTLLREDYSATSDSPRNLHRRECRLGRAGSPLRYTKSVSEKQPYWKQCNFWNLFRAHICETPELKPLHKVKYQLPRSLFELPSSSLPKQANKPAVPPHSPSNDKLTKAQTRGEYYCLSENYPLL